MELVFIPNLDSKAVVGSLIALQGFFLVLFLVLRYSYSFSNAGASRAGAGGATGDEGCFGGLRVFTRLGLWSFADFVLMSLLLLTCGTATASSGQDELAGELLASGAIGCLLSNHYWNFHLDHHSRDEVVGSEDAFLKLAFGSKKRARSRLTTFTLLTSFSAPLLILGCVLTKTHEPSVAMWALVPSLLLLSPLMLVGLVGLIGAAIFAAHLACAAWARCADCASAGGRNRDDDGGVASPEGTQRKQEHLAISAAHGPDAIPTSAYDTGRPSHVGGTTTNPLFR